jgi:hypothetical protein
VLYFLNFSFNLISIPKLTRNLKRHLTFDSNECFMEDTHTKRMIDAAKMVHGLYTLTTPLVSIATNPINHCINVTNNTHLNSTVEYNKWHMIFTHPSYEKLIAINKKFPFVKIVKSNLTLSTWTYRVHCLNHL